MGLDHKAKIVVVGDVMIDRYLDGHASRISPEAPVPILRARSSREVPGGAANVALNIAALGGEVTLISYVGDDEDALCLHRMMEAAGVLCVFVTSKSSRTIVKLRALCMHQQMLRLDFEDDFATEDHRTLLDSTQGYLPNADVLVLSDYAKGTLTEVQQLIALGRDAGVRVVVDPKGSDFTRYAGAYVITPNESEFRSASGYTARESDAALEAGGRAFRDKMAVDNLLVTRGEQGMMLVGQSMQTKFIGTEAKDVFDVTGAGDTVIGALAFAIASGASIADAMVLANRAAGIVVGRHGTSAVSHEELFGLPSYADDAFVAIRVAQCAGERIVMTNGCFDIIHAGHVRYLEEARKWGDRLVVALNSDASVRRLKGSPRPVNGFEHRKAVLQGLRSVDWVVEFGDDDGDENRDTPVKIIARIAPDVLVKRADYTVNTIASAAEVLARGGEVRTVELVNGISTSELLRRRKTSPPAVDATA